MGDTAQSRMHPKRAAYDPHCLQRHSCFANSCQICTPRELVNPPRRPPCCTEHQPKENHMTGTNRGRAVPYKSKNHAPKIAKAEMSKSRSLFFWHFSIFACFGKQRSHWEIVFPRRLCFVEFFSFLCHGRHSTEPHASKKGSIRPSLPATT